MATPLPYDQSQAYAQHAYQQAIQSLNKKKAQSLQYYGYKQKGGSYRLDPNATYGAFQMQSRSQGQQLGELGEAQIQSGLGQGLYGGSAGLAQAQRGEALYAQGFERSNLLREFQEKMEAIRLGRREARWTRNNDALSGTLQSVLSAIAGGQFTPAGPVGVGY